MATFYNLTNHPSSKWSEEQKAAALHMVGGENGDGEIVDIPFPNIPPEATGREVRKTAFDYLVKYFDDADTESVVLIQGEMVFTFNMVFHLQIKRIRCVAATTERKVEERPNGEKVSVFKFVKFRKY